MGQGQGSGVGSKARVWRAKASASCSINTRDTMGALPWQATGRWRRHRHEDHQARQLVQVESQRQGLDGEKCASSRTLLSGSARCRRGATGLQKNATKRLAAPRLTRARALRLWARQVKKLVRDMSIQLDNLCQFVPQVGWPADKVVVRRVCSACMRHPRLPHFFWPRAHVVCAATRPFAPLQPAARRLRRPFSPPNNTHVLRARL